MSALTKKKTKNIVCKSRFFIFLSFYCFLDFTEIPSMFNMTNHIRVDICITEMMFKVWAKSNKAILKRWLILGRTTWLPSPTNIFTLSITRIPQGWKCNKGFVSIIDNIDDQWNKNSKSIYYKILKCGVNGTRLLEGWLGYKKMTICNKTWQRDTSEQTLNIRKDKSIIFSVHV